MRSFILVCWLVLAAIPPTASLAQRAPTGRAIAEGTFRYARTFAPWCGQARYLHEYVGEHDEHVLVASSEAQPSERDQIGLLRYRPARRHTVRFSSNACAHAPAEEVQVDGELIDFRGYPVEQELFRYVNRYVPACMNADRSLYELVSLDGSTRLLVSSLAQPFIPGRVGDIHAIRFRRMPARIRRFSPNACSAAPPIELETHGEAIAIGPAADTGG